MRGSGAAYPSTFAAFAFLATTTDEIDVGLLGTILVFCEIGVSSAAALSEQWSSRNSLALLRVALSLLGTGIKMDRAFLKDSTELETWHFLLVVALASVVLIIPLALGGQLTA